MSDWHSGRMRIRRLRDLTVISFAPKPILDDETSIQDIGKKLYRLVDEQGCKNILIDLGNIEYLTSAALGMLITLNKKVQAGGGRLALCSIPPQIHKVFESTGLDRFFRIDACPDLSSASPDDESDEELGGVNAPIKPPRPSDSGSVSLRPPPPEEA
jgi:anti-anti-sigma factor